MIYVLETRGKKESVEGVILHIFDNVEDANNYIKENEAPDEKYYRCLKIIDPEVYYNVHGSMGEDYPAEIQNY